MTSRISRVRGNLRVCRKGKVHKTNRFWCTAFGAFGRGRKESRKSKFYVPNVVLDQSFPVESERGLEDLVRDGKMS